MFILFILSAQENLLLKYGVEAFLAAGAIITTWYTLRKALQKDVSSLKTQVIDNYTELKAEVKEKASQKDMDKLENSVTCLENKLVHAIEQSEKRTLTYMGEQFTHIVEIIKAGQK